MRARQDAGGLLEGLIILELAAIDYVEMAEKFREVPKELRERTALLGDLVNRCAYRDSGEGVMVPYFEGLDAVVKQLTFKELNELAEIALEVNGFKATAEGEEDETKK